MLIVDGPDNVGKTRLCHELVARLNEHPFVPTYTYMHLGPPPDKWDSYHDYLPLMGSHCVWDRFHFSELVYGPLGRGVTRITIPELRLLEAQLAMLGTMTVIVVAKEEAVITDNWNEEREMYTEAQVRTVNQAFKEIIQASPEQPRVDFAYEARLGEDQQFIYPSSDRGFVKMVIKAYLAMQEANDQIFGRTTLTMNRRAAWTPVL